MHRRHRTDPLWRWSAYLAYGVNEIDKGDAIINGKRERQQETLSIGFSMRSREEGNFGV
jgi:hypothetical protein